MKLIVILLMISIVQVSASTYGQSVTLRKQKISIENVFRQIRKQTGYDILVENTKFNLSEEVNVDFNRETLENVLIQLIRDKKFSFTIRDRMVVISEKIPSLVEKMSATIRSVLYFDDLTAKVTDSLGQPLVGASITLKGAKSFHALTDNYGRFKFDAVPFGVYQLTISYIGYDRLEKTIDFKGGPSELRFSLSQATSKLDQVQVIAYGSNTKRFSVGSSVTVDAETIAKQPVSNVLLALQGQVPGLSINPTGGAPGSAVKLQIRGQNSLRTGPFAGAVRYDQPLFIVDGVPFATQNKSMGDLLTLAISTGETRSVTDNGVSPFGTINPADIESISILKDADATSIYGSQGANGVVLITTKKGKVGKPSLSIDANSGVTVPTRSLDMMNTDQYLAIRREAVANDKIVFTPSNLNTYRDLRIFDPNRSVNWYDEFFNRTPVNTDVHMSFSGGQANTTFILSGGYGHNSYNFPGNFAEDRFTLHSGYTYHSTDNKLTVQFGTDFAYNTNNASAQPAVSAAMSMVPNFPEMVDQKGNLIWKYSTYVFSTNQYANLRMPASIALYNLNTTAHVAYQIISNLSFSTNIGYNRTSGNNYSARPLYAQDPTSIQTISSANFSNNTYHALNVEPQLNYERQIGAGVFSVLLGGTYRKLNSYSESIGGVGYPNDDLLTTVSAASRITALNSSSINKYVAGYARIGYIYDQKYILNLTGRRDGSSNFGPGRRFGNFGSIGLGWIFSEEQAFAKTFPFVSYGKLSANYGTNGSDVQEAYRYQALYDIEANTTTNAYQGVRPYTPYNLYNPDFSWSTKKSWNAALDLGLFNNRVLFNVTAYLNRTTDELLAYVLPSQTGFTEVLDNFGATMQNKGLEFTLSTTNVQTRNFKWTSNFNIGFNKNIVAEFPGIETSSYSQFYTVGKSPGLVQGYQYKGINQTTGLFEFYKANGTLTSNPNYLHATQGGDVQPLFNTDPKFNGGFGNSLTYKGLSLTAFFQFTKKRGLNYIAGVYNYGTPGQMFNLPEALIGKFWQKSGDDTMFQRLSTSNSGANNAVTAFKNSSGAYGDASYLRLKTVSLSYNFPDHLLKSMGVKNLRMYMNAQNLLTISGYELGDPEQAGSLYTIPLQRTLVAGLSFNF